MTKYRLGEIVDIKYGKDHKKLNVGKIPVYGTGGIMRYVDNYLYDGESVLIPRKGSLNNIYYVVGKFWTVDTIFWTVINKNIILPKYLFYFLKRIDFEKLNVGSAVPSLTQKILNEIQIDIPSIEKQKDIIDKISVFERKINLNNKINSNLLEFVTLIWKKYNSNTVNGVTLKKLANTIVTGKTPSTKIKENYGNDIPFVKIPDMHNKVFIDETSQSLTLQGANSQKNKYIPANSILVSCIGTPGLVSITDKNVQTNQQINSLILDEKYLYCTFIELRSNKDMIGNLGSGGTTIKNLNKTDFSNIVINIPNTDKLLEKFNSVARPIFNNIHENMIQTQKLKKIKATLLSEYF